MRVTTMSEITRVRIFHRSGAVHVRTTTWGNKTGVITERTTLGIPDPGKGMITVTMQTPERVTRRKTPATDPGIVPERTTVTMKTPERVIRTVK